MSWLFSQVLVEEYLEENSLDGGRCAPLKTTPTPEAFLSNGKTREKSNLSRYGMILQHLTEKNGLDVLTWFRAGFRAKIFHQPDRIKVLQELNLAYGQTWSGSSMKYHPDTFSWKIRRSSFFVEHPPFSGTWSDWGMILSGGYLGLNILKDYIIENEYGSWPTIVKSETMGGASCRAIKLTDYLIVLDGYVPPYLKGKKNSGPNVRRGKVNPEWAEWFMGWPQGWTNVCKELEMGKFQQWWKQHGRC